MDARRLGARGCARAAVNDRRDESREGRCRPNGRLPVSFIRRQQTVKRRIERASVSSRDELLAEETFWCTRDDDERDLILFSSTLSVPPRDSGTLSRGNSANNSSSYVSPNTFTRPAILLGRSIRTNAQTTPNTKGCRHILAARMRTGIEPNRLRAILRMNARLRWRVGSRPRMSPTRTNPRVFFSSARSYVYHTYSNASSVSSLVQSRRGGRTNINWRPSASSAPSGAR